MRGAVAAGNRHTAEAGAWALAQGGTAVDAVVAAALAAFVAEGPLTGPAGGGFCLVRAVGAEPTLLDCFFAVPSRPQGPMDEVLIDFGDASTQVFHVGAGSVAVPGLVPGLAEAHARHGRLSWAMLFEPALELAHAGVEMSGPQRFLLEILVPILERTEEGRGIYASHTRAETVAMVPGLERLRDHGASCRGRADAGPRCRPRGVSRDRADADRGDVRGDAGRHVPGALEGRGGRGRGARGDRCPRPRDDGHARRRRSSRLCSPATGARRTSRR